MAKELKPTDGFIFHGWMVTDLHLTGGELVAFALVHQFSQSDAGRYLGGPGYLSAWMGCSVNTARKYLHALLDKGLVVNEDQEVNGVLFRRYRVNYEAIQNPGTTSKNWSTPLQNLEMKNNRDSNIPKGIDINTPPISPRRFSFREALVGLGVEPEIADAWLQVRKAKKGVNTEVAFQAIEKEIELSGRPANECIRLAVERSWCGFKAEWMENDCSSRSSRPTPGTERNARPGRTGSTDRMLALCARMFGPQTPVYDEQ